MGWVALTIGAIVSRATYGVMSKVMSRRLATSAQTASFALQILSAVLSLLVSPFIGGLSMDGVASRKWALAIAIAASSVGNALYFHGISKLEAGVAQIAFSSIIGFGAIASVVMLGSHFAMVQIIGGAGLIGAIVLAQYDRSNRVNSGVWWIVAAAACFAVFQVESARIAERVAAGAYLVLTYLGAALLTLVFSASRVRADVRVLTRQSILATVISAALSTAYYVFAFFAYRHAPDAGVVVVLLASQVVLAVLLSAIFLRERSRLPQKVVAGVLAAVSGALIRH